VCLAESSFARDLRRISLSNTLRLVVPGGVGAVVPVHVPRRALDVVGGDGEIRLSSVCPATVHAVISTTHTRLAPSLHLSHLSSSLSHTHVPPFPYVAPSSAGRGFRRSADGVDAGESGCVRWQVTVPLPLVLLVAIIAHGSSHQGSSDGVRAYMGHWDLALLNDAVVWQEAASQIFYSTGVGFGCLSAFASWRECASPYLVPDTFIVALTNSGFSILAGFAVYTVLGVMARQLGVHVDEVVDTGPGTCVGETSKKCPPPCRYRPPSCVEKREGLDVRVQSIKGVSAMSLWWC